MEQQRLQNEDVAAVEVKEQPVDEVAVHEEEDLMEEQPEVTRKVLEREDVSPCSSIASKVMPGPLGQPQNPMSLNQEFTSKLEVKLKQVLMEE